MTIGVISPHSGNITSVCDALDRLNRRVRVLERPDLTDIDQLILPGQGRFGPVMTYLEEAGWMSALRQWVANDRPLLGICVGMQVLFESSDEDPGTPGLGVFRGHAHLLDAPKRPMIGWANVAWASSEFDDGAAYFVNSFVIGDHPNSIATTVYGEVFCAAVRRGRTLAVQFHPEKSGAWGKEMLHRCLVC